jgi:outer membrane lipoprotein carrier protein
VIFGASPKMRWAYAKPEAKTFVFDGATSWFYVPSDRQVSVNRLSEKDRQGLPFLLLADASALSKNYVVKESRRGDVVTTNLTSRDPASMIRQITVTTSARARTVSKLEYSDRQGNKTEFTFSGYQKVASSPEQFTFVAPAGVQVVRN